MFSITTLFTRSIIQIACIMVAFVCISQGYLICLGQTDIGGSVAAGATAMTVGFGALLLATYVSMRFCVTGNWVRVLLVLTILQSGACIVKSLIDKSTQEFSKSQLLPVLIIPMVFSAVIAGTAWRGQLAKTSQH